MTNAERNCRDRPVAGQAGPPTVAFSLGLSLTMQMLFLVLHSEFSRSPESAASQSYVVSRREATVSVVSGFILMCSKKCRQDTLSPCCQLAYHVTGNIGEHCDRNLQDRCVFTGARYPCNIPQHLFLAPGNQETKLENHQIGCLRRWCSSNLSVRLEALKYVYRIVQKKSGCCGACLWSPCWGDRDRWHLGLSGSQPSLFVKPQACCM